MGRVHWHPKTCKDCGRGAREGVTISQQGYCRDDWERRLRENNEQLRAHSGPYFEHWRRRNLAAFGIIVLDEPQPER
jgi:hypothetical protein